MARGVQAAVAARVAALPAGSAFTAADFADVADPALARQALARMAAAGAAARVARGVYARPPLGDGPDAGQVALALARARGWDIVPAGRSALAALGLADPDPGVAVYASSGPYYKMALGARELIFKHAAGRSLSGMSPATRLVVQALKAMGKGNVGPAEEAALAARLDDGQRAALAAETARVDPWMRKVLLRVSAANS